MKKVVHYVKYGLSSIIEGHSAVVLAIDHPDFQEQTFVRTSRVIKYDELTGEFETLNTIYKPMI